MNRAAQYCQRILAPRVSTLHRARLTSDKKNRAVVDGPYLSAYCGGSPNLYLSVGKSGQGIQDTFDGDLNLVPWCKSCTEDVFANSKNLGALRVGASDLN